MIVDPLNKSYRAVVRELLEFLPDGYEPEHIAIDPAPACNLRCPFCATGNGTADLNQKFMSLKQFKNVLDRLDPAPKMLDLFRWGESLLNPDIYAMLEEASRRKIWTCIHANLSHSWFDAKAAQRLVHSGLCLLVVSCDGAGQETYQKYRVGGNFDTVMRNIKLILAAKKKLKAEKPVIVWKFLIHKGNQWEISKAVQLAKKMGVPIRFERMQLPQADSYLKEWCPDKNIAQLQKQVKSYSRKHESPAAFGAKMICLTAWGLPTIVGSTGNVLPCCRVESEKYSLGNIYKEKLADIWNKPLIVAMRRYVATGKRSAMDLPCYECPENPRCSRETSELQAGKA